MSQLGQEVLDVRSRQTSEGFEAQRGILRDACGAKLLGVSRSARRWLGERSEGLKVGGSYALPVPGRPAVESQRTASAAALHFAIATSWVDPCTSGTASSAFSIQHSAISSRQELISNAS
jgi:hypothetical protein